MTTSPPQGATATLSRAEELSWAEDLPVVTNAKRILQPKAPISRFGDDVWSLAPIAPRRKRTRLNLNFRLVPEQFRVPVKQTVWVAINEGVPDQTVWRGGTSTKQFPSAGTISTNFHHTKAFLRGVVELQPEVRSMRGITEETMSKHINGLEGDANKTSQMAVARQLHDLTQGLIPRNRLTEPPWLHETGPRRTYGGENKTPIMPVDIATPLLLWAVAFVNEFAEDILLADEAVNAWKPKAVEYPSNTEREAFLDTWQARFGPVVPSTTKSGTLGFAFKYACFLVRSPVAYEKGFLRPVTDYPQMELNPDPHCPISTPVNGRIHGKTWQPRGIDFYETALWRRHLQTAAMILLGLNSATRPEELLNLEAEVGVESGEKQASLERVEAPDGQVRYLLTGFKFKGVNDPNGLVRTWPLTESGAQAIRVLVRIGDGTGRLFAARGTNTDPSGEFPVMTTNVANKALKDFAAVTRELTRDLELPPEYLLPDDAEDFLTLGVLRRTSEAITQEEIGGVLAGAHVAGHTVKDAYDTRQTESYGSRMSTTKTGWDRQTTDRVEALAHLVIEAQRSAIGGPAGDRATRIAEMAVAELELVDPANLMTPLRSKEWNRIAKSLDQDVYEIELASGYVSYCVFNLPTAGCTEEGEGPSLANCKLTCRNRADTPGSIVGLQLRKEEREAQAEDPTLTKEERIRARVLAEEYGKQISQSGLVEDDTP